MGLTYPVRTLSQSGTSVRNPSRSYAPANTLAIDNSIRLILIWSVGPSLGTAPHHVKILCYFAIYILFKKLFPILLNKENQLNIMLSKIMKSCEVFVKNILTAHWFRR